MRIAMAVVVGAACALTSGGRELPVAPPPRAKPIAEDWLPKPGSAPPVERGVNGLPLDPPSAFPEIEISQADRADILKRDDAFEKRCPRILGTIPLKIEATDNGLQKLLKARLHQAVLEYPHYRVPIMGRPLDHSRHLDCLASMQSVAVELWSGQPKEMILWLEEILIASKDVEWKTRHRAAIGVVHPIDLYAATRVRLKVEAELWKAKNAK